MEEKNTFNNNNTYDNNNYGIQDKQSNLSNSNNAKVNENKYNHSINNNDNLQNNIDSPYFNDFNSKINISEENKNNSNEKKIPENEIEFEIEIEKNYTSNKHLLINNQDQLNSISFINNNNNINNTYNLNSFSYFNSNSNSLENNLNINLNQNQYQYQYQYQIENYNNNDNQILEDIFQQQKKEKELNTISQELNLIGIKFNPQIFTNFANILETETNINIETEKELQSNIESNKDKEKDRDRNRKFKINFLNFQDKLFEIFYEFIKRKKIDDKNLLEKSRNFLVVENQKKLIDKKMENLQKNFTEYSNKIKDLEKNINLKDQEIKQMKINLNKITENSNDKINKMKLKVNNYRKLFEEKDMEIKKMLEKYNEKLKDNYFIDFKFNKNSKLDIANVNSNIDLLLKARINRNKNLDYKDIMEKKENFKRFENFVNLNMHDYDDKFNRDNNVNYIYENIKDNENHNYIINNPKNINDLNYNVSNSNNKDMLIDSSNPNNNNLTINNNPFRDLGFNNPCNPLENIYKENNNNNNINNNINNNQEMKDLYIDKGFKLIQYLDNKNYTKNLTYQYIQNLQNLIIDINNKIFSIVNTKLDYKNKLEKKIFRTEKDKFQDFISIKNEENLQKFFEISFDKVEKNENNLNFLTKKIQKNIEILIIIIKETQELEDFFNSPENFYEKIQKNFTNNLLEKKIFSNILIKNIKKNHMENFYFSEKISEGKKFYLDNYKNFEDFFEKIKKNSKEKFGENFFEIISEKILTESNTTKILSEEFLKKNFVFCTTAKNLNEKSIEFIRNFIYNAIIEIENFSFILKFLFINDIDNINNFFKERERDRIIKEEKIEQENFFLSLFSKFFEENDNNNKKLKGILNENVKNFEDFYNKEIDFLKELELVNLNYTNLLNEFDKKILN